MKIVHQSGRIPREEMMIVPSSGEEQIAADSVSFALNTNRAACDLCEYANICRRK